MNRFLITRASFAQTKEYLAGKRNKSAAPNLD